MTKIVLKLSFLVFIQLQVFAQRPGTIVKVGSVGEISGEALKKIRNSFTPRDFKIRTERMMNEKSHDPYGIRERDIIVKTVKKNLILSPSPGGKPKPNNTNTTNGLSTVNFPGLHATPELKQFIDLSQTPPPEISWKAPTSNAGDVTLAVSTTNVLVTTWNYMEFLDRSGNFLQGFNIDDFFTEFHITDSIKISSNDTRSIYDPYRNRFWIVTQTNTNVMLLAVSKTSDPTQGFYGYYLDSTADENGIDYPELAITEHVLTLTNWSGAYMYDADLLASNIKSDGVKIMDFRDSQNHLRGRLAPVMQYGTSPFVYFISIEYTTNNIYLFEYKNSLKSNKLVNSWIVNFDNTNLHTPVDKNIPERCGPQKNSDVNLWFDNLAGVILSACFRNDFFTLAIHQGYDWYNDGKFQSAVRIIRLHMTPATVIGGKFGLICDVNQIMGNSFALKNKKAPRVWAGFPSVAVNKSGDILTCFAKTGTDMFPQAAYAGKRFNSPNFLRENVLKEGEGAFRSSVFEADPGWIIPYDNNNPHPPGWPPAPPNSYKRFPWADCSGICIDPLDDESFWIADVYGTSANNWNIGVWVGKVKL